MYDHTMAQQRRQLAGLREKLTAAEAERDEARSEAEQWEQARDAEVLQTVRVFDEYYRRWQSTIVEARRQHARAEQAEARVAELEAGLANRTA